MTSFKAGTPSVPKALLRPQCCKEHPWTGDSFEAVENYWGEVDTSNFLLFFLITL